MTDNTTSVSVVINAPVDRVWPLLLEKNPQPGQPDQQRSEQRHFFWSDLKGMPTEGQVIHTKLGPFRSTIHIDRVMQAEPPLIGQTTFARASVWRREGKSVVSWMHDHEHHHMQVQYELKHPFGALAGYTNISCVPIEATSCVVVYIEKSEMVLRLVPRWLAKRLDASSGKMATVRVENALQEIKIQAEQPLD